MMRLKALRCTSLVTFSVLGAVLVLCYVVATEKHSAKLAWIQAVHRTAGHGHSGALGKAPRRLLDKPQGGNSPQEYNVVDGGPSKSAIRLVTAGSGIDTMERPDELGIQRRNANNKTSGMGRARFKAANNSTWNDMERILSSSSETGDPGFDYVKLNTSKNYYFGLSANNRTFFGNDLNTPDQRPEDDTIYLHGNESKIALRNSEKVLLRGEYKLSGDVVRANGFNFRDSGNKTDIERNRLIRGSLIRGMYSPGNISHHIDSKRQEVIQRAAIQAMTKVNRTRSLERNGIQIPRVRPLEGAAYVKEQHNEAAKADGKGAGVREGYHYKKNYRRRLGFRKIGREQSVLKEVNWQPRYDDHNYSYLIQPDKDCGGAKGEFQETLLVVLVLTGPDHFTRRRVIRHTWLRYAIKERLDMKAVFLVAATNNTAIQRYIKSEALMYRDILQEDFQDSYVNLTLKTLMGLKWATQFCPKAKYVMKVDDDVAVNVKPFLQYLQARNVTTNYIGGIVTRGSVPYRAPDKKWFVPEDLYPEPTYPPYLQGKSYIMSMDVARQVFEVSKTLVIFPWEDVFIGLCLREIGLAPEDIPGFESSTNLVGPDGNLKRYWFSLKSLLKKLIVYDLNEAHMDVIWQVWEKGMWPTARKIHL